MGAELNKKKKKELHSSSKAPFKKSIQNDVQLRRKLEIQR
jgi:hypothetical protein